MNDQDPINKKLELYLFIIILFLLTVNALGTSILTAFTNASWGDMGGDKKVLLVIAIITNWTGVMIALFNRGFSRLVSGKPLINGTGAGFDTSQFRKPTETQTPPANTASTETIK